MDRRQTRIRAGQLVLGMALAIVSPRLADAAPDPSVTAPRAAPGFVSGKGAAPLSGLPPMQAASPTPMTLVADGGEIAAGNPVVAPFKWAGLWYVTHDDGKEFSCTAQFITDTVILLAAHCVRDQDTGKFYTTSNKNSGFLLQYQNRDYSREYHDICRTTWGEWVVQLQPGEDPSKPDTMSEARRQQYFDAKRQAWQWDYAFVLLDGKSLTGHYNYRTNTRADGAVSTGYPGALMGGQVIQHVDGDVFSEHDLMYSLGDQGNEQVMWHGNAEHTQGSSGGAWVANLSSTVSPDTNIIIGLNSYGSSDKPGASFGPLFTDRFQSLLDFAAKGCK